MTETLPVGLAEMLPGADLGVVLDGIESAGVADDEFHDVLVAEYRQLCYQQARFLDRVAALGDRARSYAARAGQLESVAGRIAAEELGAELRFGYRYALRLVAEAEQVRACPVVAAALAAGRIDQVRAVILACDPHGLTAEQLGVVHERLLPTAGGLSTGELRAKVRALAVALDPGWAQRHYQAAAREPRLFGYLNADGTAVFGASGLAPADAQAACERVEDLARAARAAGFPGTLHQARAALYIGLLDGRFHGLARPQIIAALLADHSPDDTASAEPSEEAEPAVSEPAVVPRARGVEVRLRLSTALGLDDLPGEIAGMGPVTAAEAARVLATHRHAQWRYVLCDEQGRYLRHGLLRTRPALDWAARQTEGGIVELHAKVADLARLAAHAPPEWAGFLQQVRDTDDRGRVRRRPVDPTRRFPTAEQRRDVELRDRSCIFPGHWTPARRNDIDHTRDHAHGGDTDPANLRPPCRRHHTAKTKGWWTYRITDNGAAEWTSPFGRVHVQQQRPVIDDLPPPRPRPPQPDGAPRTEDGDDPPLNFGSRAAEDRPDDPATRDDEPAPF